MIRVVKQPKIKPDTAEGIKIIETFKAYGSYATFWHQNGGKSVISLLDGDMVIAGHPSDFEELSSFIRLIAPKSIFSSAKTLKGLGLFEKSLIVSVLSTDRTYDTKEKTVELSSREVYALLKSADFELPDYEYFATDYCLRLNKGRLKYFAIDNVAVAMCIGKKNVLINGLVSLKRGNGGKCLQGLLSNVKPRTAFVCATTDVEGFYLKNGFKKDYDAGYWRK